MLLIGLMVVCGAGVAAAVMLGRGIPARVIAATSSAQAQGRYRVTLIDIDGGQHLQLRLPVTLVRGAGFSPDGRRVLLFSANPNFQTQSFDIYDIPQQRIIYTVAMPGQAAGDVFIMRRYEDYTPTWSPDGQRIAFRDPGANGLYLIDLQAGGTRQVFANAMIYSMAWSPDGGRLAFIAAERLHLLDVATGAVRRIPVENAQAPQWSPDSEQVAFFQVDAESRAAVTYMLRVDDAPSVANNMTDDPPVDGHPPGLQNLSERFGDIYLPQWSPDGAWLAFYAGREGQRIAYTLNLAEDVLHVMPVADVRLAAWSADGRYLTVEGYLDLTQRRIHIVTPEGEPVQQFTTGRFTPYWAADDSRLLYLSVEDSATALYLTDLNAEPVLLAAGVAAPVWVDDAVAFLQRDRANSRLIHDGHPLTAAAVYILDFVYWR